MGKKVSIYQQIALNAVPVVGYWFWNWSMFSIVYIYWVEAVVISFFVALKVILARGPEPATGRIPSLSQRVWSGIKVLLFRMGVLMFYWIFIFVFVCMGQGRIETSEAIENVKIIVFMHQGFNLAVLAFFLSQVIEFTGNFILNDAYKLTASSEHKSLFDRRTIIIHVVVVLGTFSYQFLNRYAVMDNRFPGLGFVLVVFLAKTVADIIQHGSGGKPEPSPLMQAMFRKK